MTLTVLFDLDDTLLSSNMDTFLPAYLQALARYLSHRFDGEQFIRRLLHATQKMIENNRPDRTLEQVFAEDFYPALGVQPEEMRVDLDAFYAEVFPSLKPLTAPRPEAIRLVETATKRGYRLAVATSPIFPKTAILQRLAWAGLPVTDYPFQLVSSYETFHFAKPNPAFYTEFLAQMGWPAGPAAMIGNDPQNDAIPAGQVGLFSYLIGDPQTAAEPELGLPHALGRFADILPWLDRLPDQPPDAAGPEALLPVLQSTPAALATLTANLTLAEWSVRPQPGEWSLTEIMCHLRDVAAEVDLPRIRKVLEEENPFIPAMDSDDWAAERRYASQNGVSALSHFMATRIQLLDLLRSLAPSDWDRPARHAIFGPTRLRELIRFIATHDRAHVQQSFQARSAAVNPTPASI
jgi:FMN phosphatase YigB (HAD superfamily)